MQKSKISAIDAAMEAAQHANDLARAAVDLLADIDLPMEAEIDTRRGLTAAYAVARAVESVTGQTVEAIDALGGHTPATGEPG